MRDTRMHGSTGGAGEGAFYGNRFTASLGKPRDLSPVSPTACCLTSSLPNQMVYFAPTTGRRKPIP